MSLIHLFRQLRQAIIVALARRLDLKINQGLFLRGGSLGIRYI